MSHHAKPKLAKCFKCKEWFLIKFVPFYKRFSLKNSWEYWTQKEEDDKKKDDKKKDDKKKDDKKKDDKKKDDKKICDNCLKKSQDEIKKFAISRVKATLDQYIRRMARSKST